MSIFAKMSKQPRSRRRAGGQRSRGLLCGWLLVAAGLGGCASDEAAQAPGPPLKPGTGTLGQVGDRELRIEALRVVEALQAERAADLPNDWARARALGALTTAMLVEDAVRSASLEVDAAAVELAAAPLAAAAERRLPPSSSAELALVDVVARRLALASVTGTALVRAKGQLTAPSGETVRMLSDVDEDDDGPVAEIVMAILPTTDPVAARGRALRLGRKVRDRPALLSAATAAAQRELAPGVVPRQMWVTPARTAPGLAQPLFAAAPGTVVGPVVVPGGWAIARVIERHHDGEAPSSARGARAARAMEALAQRTLERQVWADASVTLDDLSLRRWLSAADLGPDGLAWSNPCDGPADVGEPIAGRCAALRAVLERSDDASRFVAHPRDHLLAACADGDRDACLAVGDDRVLPGLRLSALLGAADECSADRWPCDRAALLAPLAETPLASVGRTLIRLSRRCATWDPATCPRFAALVEVLRTHPEASAVLVRLEAAPLTWALQRGCERSGDLAVCHLVEREPTSAVDDVITCFEPAVAPGPDALRAQRCRRVAARSTGGADRGLALSRACRLGDPPACHHAAQAALVDGDLDGAADLARRALAGAGGDEGAEAALSLRVVAAQTGCAADDDDACLAAAELVLSASEGAAARAAADRYLNKACRTSAAACRRLAARKLDPADPDPAAALEAAARGCRGAQARACRLVEQLEVALASCPLDDDAAADCASLAGFFTTSGASPAALQQGLALLSRACAAGDREACRRGIVLAVGGRLPGDLDAAAILCRQPAASQVATCRHVRALPAQEAACHAGVDEDCVKAAQTRLASATPGPDDQARATELLERACQRGAEPACAELERGAPSMKERGLRAACANAPAPKKWGACAELAHHLRQQLVPPARPTESLELARAACDGGDAAACRVLGDLLETGETGPWDPGGAMKAWEQGCTQGDLASCQRVRTRTPSGG